MNDCQHQDVNLGLPELPVGAIEGQDVGRLNARLALSHPSIRWAKATAFRSKPRKNRCNVCNGRQSVPRQEGIGNLSQADATAYNERSQESGKQFDPG
jgi:hypothetical protein